MQIVVCGNDALLWEDQRVADSWNRVLASAPEALKQTLIEEHND